MNALSVSALADLAQLWPWWFSTMLKATVWLTAWWLVESAWQRRSSSLRHVVAVLAACGLPVIFVVNLSPRPERYGWQPLAPVWERVAGPDRRAERTARPEVREIAEEAAAQVYDPTPKRPFWPGVVMALWGTGVLSCWMGLVVRSWPRRLPGRSADRASDGTMVQVFERECARLAMTRCPRLRVVPCGVPRLIGLWGPALELPEAAQDWTEEKLSAVLRHELAHLRRSDLWWLVATEAALALVWGHPLRGILRRRLARLREEACDDAVIASGLEPSVYAAHLASFLTASEPTSRAWSLPAVQPNGWLGRFRRMLDQNASRRPARASEIIVLSLVSGVVVSVGTICVGCAGPREDRPAGTNASSSDPITPPRLHPAARKLSIELKVVEATVRPREAETLGFREGFPSLMGRVLTMEEGGRLFHPGRSQLRFATVPKPTAKPGQELKFESAKPVRYPVEFVPNARTGVLEPLVYEEQKVGVFLNLAVWPTEDPDRIHLRYRFELKEHEGYTNYPQAGAVQPVFNTRRSSDEIDMLNGSYIVLGYKPSTQKLADFVPLRSNEAQYRRWLQEAAGEEYGRLAAVQVIVEELRK